MTGSGQPIERRTASISTTSSTVPMAMSMGSGLPTRNCN